MAINFRGNGVNESLTSPASLGAGQLNLTLTGLVGTAGQAMGVMGLTYTQPELAYGILEYQTKQSEATRLQIRLDK